jgi:hypothetical protein
MLGLLPWEKWLPPYVFGPLICASGICILVFGRPLSWWEILLAAFSVIYGALGTGVWIATRRNMFDYSDGETKDPPACQAAGQAEG